MEKRDWLIYSRKIKHLKQSEVAQVCGISQTYYSKLELGTKTPSIMVAKKLARLLDFSWTKFF